MKDFEDKISKLEKELKEINRARNDEAINYNGMFSKHAEEMRKFLNGIVNGHSRKKILEHWEFVKHLHEKKEIGFKEFPSGYCDNSSNRDYRKFYRKGLYN